MPTWYKTIKTFWSDDYASNSNEFKKKSDDAIKIVIDKIVFTEHLQIVEAS